MDDQPLTTEQAPGATTADTSRAALTEIVTAMPQDSAVLAVSHGGAIRSFVHAVTGLTPPPLDNGALFRARFEDNRFVAADLEPI